METYRFRDRYEFRLWLEANHEQTESIWIEFVKGKKSVFKHVEALNEALCYGWIDSLLKRVDNEIYKIKYSKRSPKSGWSEHNKERVEKLIAEGVMTEYGLATINIAKKNGKWENSTIIVNDEMIAGFKKYLEHDAVAYDKFDTLSFSMKSLCVRYYGAAKQEATKERRLAKLFDFIKTGKRLM